MLGRNERELLSQCVGKAQKCRGSRIASATLDAADLSLLNAGQLRQCRLGEGSSPTGGRKHDAEFGAVGT